MINKDRVSDVAAQLAFLELLRLVIAEAFFTPDADLFRQRMEALERAAVNGLSSRTPFSGLDDATNNQIKESACDIVTKIMTSIHHPGQ